MSPPSEPDPTIAYCEEHAEEVVGITIAALTMLANFAFIPYYPIWSMLIIALNVFVIWALCIYDRDTATASSR